MLSPDPQKNIASNKPWKKKKNNQSNHQSHPKQENPKKHKWVILDANKK